MRLNEIRQNEVAVDAPEPGDAQLTFIGTIRTIGDTPGERVDGPAYQIWPSDHAGLAVRVTARVTKPGIKQETKSGTQR